VPRSEASPSFVAMAACSSCGGGALPLLPFEVSETATVSGPLTNVLRDSALLLSALFGYLLPDFAMLLGAWAGASIDGSNGAAALGAIGGFLAALAIVRQFLRLLPGLPPGSRQVCQSPDSHVFQQEFHHER